MVIVMISNGNDKTINKTNILVMVILALNRGVLLKGLIMTGHIEYLPYSQRSEGRILPDS